MWHRATLFFIIIITLPTLMIKIKQAVELRINILQDIWYLLCSVVNFFAPSYRQYEVLGNGKNTPQCKGYGWLLQLRKEHVYLMKLKYLCACVSSWDLNSLYDNDVTFFVKVGPWGTHDLVHALRYTDCRHGIKGYIRIMNAGPLVI